MQLGLPQSSIRVIPTYMSGHAVDTIDVEQLRQAIDEDVTAAKTPVIIIAHLGESYTAG